VKWGIVWAALVLSTQIAAATLTTSGTLVEEVLSQSKPDPHHYDWRADSLTVNFGYGNVTEYNSFKSSYFQLGMTTAISDNWIFLTDLRRVMVQGTDSSEKFGQTPFSQSAQPSRYELMAGLGVAILDGRSQTLLSPRITDLQHALYAIAGAQYNYFPSKPEEPLAGMQPAYYDWTAQAGLRWNIYLPHSFGVAFEWDYCFPLTMSQQDLGSWQRFAGLVTWSFAQ
jgi:hypothetical protein